MPSKADSKRLSSRPRTVIRYLRPVTGQVRSPGGDCAGLGDCPGCVDQPDMAERLREVSDHLAAAGVDLLSEQANVVDRRNRPLERRRGLVHLAGQRLGMGEPEGAQQEGALLPSQAVARQVPVDQAAPV